MIRIVCDGCVVGLGSFIEAYPFEVHHVLHVVTFGPSMYFFEIEIAYS